MRVTLVFSPVALPFAVVGPLPSYLLPPGAWTKVVQTRHRRTPAHRLVYVMDGTDVTVFPLLSDCSRVPGSHSMPVCSWRTLLAAQTLAGGFR